MAHFTANSGVQTLDAITETILDHHQTAETRQRTLVSVSGIPGAGKSTLARKLSENLNRLALERGLVSHLADSHKHDDPGSTVCNNFAVDIPLDGFHLSRAQLRAMPDPETALHRRGAAFTYDSAGYRRLLEQLAQPSDSQERIVYAPAFDHTTKDPVADSIMVRSDTRIVILEGNYVNLATEPWKTASGLFRLKLSVAVDRHVAKERLIKRHVASGICEDEASAEHRVESTDDLNAEDILANEVAGVISVAVLEHW
jgi:pantothenate kinase